MGCTAMPTNLCHHTLKAKKKALEVQPVARLSAARSGPYLLPVLDGFYHNHSSGARRLPFNLTSLRAGTRLHGINLS